MDVFVNLAQACLFVLLSVISTNIFTIFTVPVDGVGDLPISSYAGNINNFLASSSKPIKSITKIVPIPTMMSRANPAVL